MSVRIAIHQPNFVPWGGYFLKMLQADVFVFLDDAQYTKNSFINRNRIRINDQAVWLTVPVRTKGNSQAPINAIPFDPNVDWRRKHLKTLEQNYGHAPHWEEVFALVQEAYRLETVFLSELNIFLLRSIAAYLRVDATLVAASADPVPGTRTDRLINLCRHFGAAIYVHGAGGETYQESQAFAEAGIDLQRCQYAAPAYPQSGKGFVPNLSILDMLFHCGRDARLLLGST